MSASKHTPEPRLSSVQRFALKEILLDSCGEVALERKYNRTRESLWSKGLLTAPACGSLTVTGRAIAKQVLQAEIARRQAQQVETTGSAV